MRSEIGKYACEHGVASTARVFTRRLEKPVSETTIRSIRNTYQKELRTKRSADDCEVSVLPSKKRGRRVLLGQELDEKVQLYLRKVREGGGAVLSRIAMAAARRILLKCDRGMLSEFGGPVELNKSWARSLLHRMKFVQRKATTAKSKHTAADFVQVKRAFLEEVVATVTMEGIPADLILNWDCTGIKFVPCSSWTSEAQDEWR